MMEHTPGPWEAKLDGDVWQVWGTRAEEPEHMGREICSILDTDEEAPFDARLIATAPELLEALKALEADLHACMPIDLVRHFGAARNMARSIIAKAEGRE